MIFSPEVLDKVYEDAFRCIFSMMPFDGPVVAEDGYTYNRVCIEQWLKPRPNGIKLSPITRQSISRHKLFPNFLLEKANKKKLSEIECEYSGKVMSECCHPILLYREGAIGFTLEKDIITVNAADDDPKFPDRFRNLKAGDKVELKLRGETQVSKWIFHAPNFAIKSLVGNLPKPSQKASPEGISFLPSSDALATLLMV